MISGGAMFGNSAIGSWTMATAPRITMMIEITIATIGRLMKNLAIETTGANRRRRRRNNYTCVISSSLLFRLLPERFRTHGHAGLEFLQSFDDYAFALA